MNTPNTSDPTEKAGAAQYSYPAGLLPEHQRALTYHPLTPGRAELHEELRAAAMLYASVIDRICPASREASVAFTSIQESLMWANAAVAIHDDRAQERG